MYTLALLIFFKQSQWSGVILRLAVWSSFGCRRGSWSTCSGRSHETSAEAALAHALSWDWNHGCGQLRCPTIAHFPSDWSQGDVECCLTLFPCLLFNLNLFFFLSSQLWLRVVKWFGFLFDSYGSVTSGEFERDPSMTHSEHHTCSESLWPTLFICNVPVTAVSPKTGASPFIVTTNPNPLPPPSLHLFYE